MSIFRRSSTITAPPAVESNRRHPFLARRDNSINSPSSGSGSKLSRSPQDSSSGFAHIFSRHETLTCAHKKLTAAVVAERAADEALIASRKAVKEARSEILKLEEEAKREAKAAKAKQQTESRMFRSVVVDLADAHNLTFKQAAKFRKEGDKLGKY